jgi:phosphate transport system protein
VSPYEERLQHDLDDIRERVSQVGSHVEQALENAVRALLSYDRRLASDTILGDLPINRAIRALDRQCHAFVARHLPSAGHLRFVSSVLRLNVALERIGDYAVNISRETAQLSSAPPPEVALDVEESANHARRVLAESLRAFHDGNAEMARGTKSVANATSPFPRAFADLIRVGEGAARPLRDLFALLVVFNALDRVADQAKNICEETIFAVTGETKEPKVYQVLFIDERNDCLSQMAEAIARKTFPQSGRYASAGWQPADKLEPTCRKFMDQHGLDLRESQPTLLDTSHAALSEYNVIVSLAPGAREHIAELPFQTVLLEWELPAGSHAESYKDISNRMRELMVTLRGESAE